MKKLSLIFAALVLSAGITFANPIQAKQTNKKDAKKAEKKSTSAKKSTKKADKADKKAK